MPKKLTTEEFIERSKIIHGEKYDYEKVEYVGGREEVEIFCNSCNVFFLQIPKNHLRGSGCQQCGINKSSRSQTRSASKFISMAKQVHGDKYDYSMVEYTSCKIDVVLLCKECKILFYQTPDHHLSGQGCRKCGVESIKKKQSLGIEKFVEKANAIHGGGSFNYSKVKYTNKEAKVIIVCNTCGKCFSQRAGSHLRGCGCPSCKKSTGEHAISLFLDENKIEYVAQKRFVGCRDKKPLSFDFYLPNHNTLIEYDGIQHFEPVEYFGGVDAFTGTKKRDIIKGEYAKRNDIELVRIPYWDKDRIEDILMDLKLSK